MILHMGGGGAKELAIRVQVGTVQPAGSAGMLWVNTATASNHWAMAVTAPAAPATGDLWVQMDAASANVVELLRKNSARIHVARVMQYDGSSWQAVEAHYYDGTDWTQISYAGIVYGFEWNYGATSPLLTRIGDSIGLTASAGVGAVTGASDFDAYPIYGDIKTCNVANDGTVNAYEGDAGFTRDGTNGEVMVEIPVGYIKVENDTANSKLRVYLSNVPKDGYAKHAAGQHNNGTQDVIYVGAYKTSASYHSKSGVASLVSETRATTRSGVKAGRGNSRWSMVDLATRQYLTLLMMIEYATLDLQGAIGQGVSAASAARNSGGTDTIAYHTGREAGTDNLVSCRWRGIENWWGNVYEWIDGFNINNGALYFCLTQDNYADDTATNYTAISYAIGTALSAAYGTRLGYDGNAPWSLLPNVHSGGSSATYLCDACWSSTGWKIGIAGGLWNDGGAGGVSAWHYDAASSSAAVYIGSRLMYTTS